MRFTHGPFIHMAVAPSGKLLAAYTYDLFPFHELAPLRTLTLYPYPSLQRVG